jgi:hypothetical protein
VEVNIRSFVLDLKYSMVFVAISSRFYKVCPMAITSQDLMFLEYTSNMYRFALSKEKISSSPAHILIENT